MGFEQVDLAGLFGMEKNCGNVEAELLFGQIGQCFMFSSGARVGEPDLENERVAEAEHRRRVASIVNLADMAVGRGRASIRQRDRRCRKDIARTVATILPQAVILAQPLEVT
jgi:hypothetical protein